MITVPDNAAETFIIMQCSRATRDFARELMDIRIKACREYRFVHDESKAPRLDNNTSNEMELAHATAPHKSEDCGHRLQAAESKVHSFDKGFARAVSELHRREELTRMQGQKHAADSAARKRYDETEW